MLEPYRVENRFWFEQYALPLILNLLIDASWFFCAKVIFFSDGMEIPTVNHPRMMVTLGNDAHLSLCHNHVSMGGVCLSNGFTRILVGQRANLVRDLLGVYGDIRAA